MTLFSLPTLQYNTQSISSHVKRKYKVINANTQMVFTGECMPMYNSYQDEIFNFTGI